MRNTEFEFVPVDTGEIEAALIAAYEDITGVSVMPASPERLFIAWVAQAIIQERVMNNYTANQNLPSRAEGQNLDAIGELFYFVKRPEEQAATCVVRFTISEPQVSSILVPVGTRVTDIATSLFWETTEDAYINIGDTSVDITVKCQTPGVIGNGYAVGQINTIVDVFNYYLSCSNITISSNGANAATDDEYYAIMRASLDAFSTAGPKGGYVYHAKATSTEIVDVVANSPEPGVVKLYILKENGETDDQELMGAVAAACNDNEIRPLTDRVIVEPAEKVVYNIRLTYYQTRNSQMSAAEIDENVQTAVADYMLWQSGKFGRDINPSEFIRLLMSTGIHRVDLQEPVFTALSDGSDGSVPQVAAVGEISVINGGYEDG